MSIDQKTIPDTFATWMGIPVFLNVIAGGIKTSLFCTIVGESNATVRVRIGNQWDVDIYKEMVLAVDEFSHAGMDPATTTARELNQTARSTQLPATADVGAAPQ